MTRLLSDWLPTAGPGTQTPARGSHRGLEPCFREVGPPRSSPTHSRALSRSGACGCSGSGVHSLSHSPRGTLGCYSVALGTLELGDGIRPSPFLRCADPEAGRPRALTAGPHFRGPGPAPSLPAGGRVG